MLKKLSLTLRTNYPKDSSPHPPTCLEPPASKAMPHRSLSQKILSFRRRNNTPRDDEDIHRKGIKQIATNIRQLVSRKKPVVVMNEDLKESTHPSLIDSVSSLLTPPPTNSKVAALKSAPLAPEPLHNVKITQSLLQRPKAQSSAFKRSATMKKLQKYATRFIVPPSSRFLLLDQRIDNSFEAGIAALNTSREAVPCDPFHLQYYTVPDLFIGGSGFYQMPASASTQFARERILHFHYGRLPIIHPPKHPRILRPSRFPSELVNVVNRAPSTSSGNAPRNPRSHPSFVQNKGSERLYTSARFYRYKIYVDERDGFLASLEEALHACICGCLIRSKIAGCKRATLKLLAKCFSARTKRNRSMKAIKAARTPGQVNDVPSVAVPALLSTIFEDVEHEVDETGTSAEQKDAGGRISDLEPVEEHDLEGEDESTSSELTAVINISSHETTSTESACSGSSVPSVTVLQVPWSDVGEGFDKSYSRAGQGYFSPPLPKLPSVNDVNLSAETHSTSSSSLSSLGSIIEGIATITPFRAKSLGFRLQDQARILDTPSTATHDERSSPRTPRLSLDSTSTLLDLFSVATPPSATSWDSPLRTPLASRDAKIRPSSVNHQLEWPSPSSPSPTSFRTVYDLHHYAKPTQSSMLKGKAKYISPPPSPRFITLTRPMTNRNSTRASLSSSASSLQPI